MRLLHDLVVREEEDKDEAPRPVCNECQNNDKFHTITYDTAYGIEYDLECDACGSRDVQSP